MPAPNQVVTATTATQHITFAVADVHDRHQRISFDIRSAISMASETGNRALVALLENQLGALRDANEHLDRLGHLAVGTARA